MTYTNLTLSNISYSYEKTKIFKDVTIKVPLEGVIQIKGINGVGKTTLINLIIGLLNPDCGENNFNIPRKDIGYAPQEPLLLEGLTIIENIQVISEVLDKPYNEKKLDKLMKLFLLDQFLNQSVTNLSGGQRQKVSLVLAFLFETRLIVLDEPSNNLDDVSSRNLVKLIDERRDQTPIILIMHDKLDINQNHTIDIRNEREITVE